jgi:glycosyltransferase involved in cell wall biosynthesis
VNICFICSEYPPGPHGGTGTFTQTIARALALAGHRVRVVGVHHRDYPAPDYQLDGEVQVWRLREPGRRGGWILARRELYRTIKRWSAEGEVDVVEAPDHEGWFAGWPALPVPIVQRAGGAYSYFAHELGQEIASHLYYLEKWSYHRCDAWIAKSLYTAAITARLFKLRAAPNAVLYNPVKFPETVSPFESRPKDQVVFTGTLTFKKGVIHLIDAWPLVRKHRPLAELHIYGKDSRSPNGGSMQEYLKSRLPLEHQSSVQFHGHVDRELLFDALSSARVGVFPSFSEGFAWAPLEAMAHGCPTVYTRLGSGPELIRDGREGILVSPDKPEQIASAIISLLEDDALSKQLGEAGRLRVQERFTMERLLPLNEGFYTNLITAHRLRRSA